MASPYDEPSGGGAKGGFNNARERAAYPAPTPSNIGERHAEVMKAFPDSSGGAKNRTPSGGGAKGTSYHKMNYYHEDD